MPLNDTNMPKNIDAVKLVREIRDKNYSEIQGKTTIEIIAYFKDKSKLLKKELQKIEKPEALN